MTAEPGALLADRYRLLERVGRGGMAEVFRGRDELLHREVAVKVFRAGDPADAASERRRIEAEMRTLAGLRHPNLVTLFDASAGDAASGHAPFLVMDYVAGPTLATRLAEGPLTPAAAAALGADLAAALQHVHDSGIVHRDVKPANILLDERDGATTARLTDFGIARITDATRLTADGWTVGTANYLSPEQARGTEVGPPSDIYSLGLVLLECLTGQVAFPGSGIEAAVARLARPPAVPPQLGDPWTALLPAMTAFEPSSRPDAAAVGRALAGGGALGSTPVMDAATVPLAGTAVLPGTAVVPDPTSPPPGTPGTLGTRKPASRSRLALIAGAVVLVAAITAIVVATTGGTTSGRPSTLLHRSSSSGTHSSGAHQPATRTNSAAARTPTSTPAPGTTPAPQPAPKPPKPKPPKPKPPKPKPHGPKPHGPKPPKPAPPGHAAGHGHGPGGPADAPDAPGA